jgi:hypothetical protein
MQKLKFSELNQKETIKAVIDYYQGYLDGQQTDVDYFDEHAFMDAFEGCKDNENEFFYDKSGRMLEESEEQ